MRRVSATKGRNSHEPSGSRVAPEKSPTTVSLLPTNGRTRLHGVHRPCPEGQTVVALGIERGEVGHTERHEVSPVPYRAAYFRAAAFSALFAATSPATTPASARFLLPITLQEPTWKRVPPMLTLPDSWA